MQKLFLSCLLKYHINRRLSKVKLLDNIILAQGQPLVSIVMPAHNCATSIESSLCSLVSSITLPAELVIVIDSSTDGTQQAVERFILSLHKLQSTILSLQLIISRLSLYETLSDVIGIQNSTAKYILEVQSDMIIMDKGFDARLIQILEDDPRLALISGRGIVPFGFSSNQKTNCSLFNCNMIVWFIREILKLPLFSSFSSFLKKVKSRSKLFPGHRISSHQDCSEPSSIAKNINLYYSTGYAGRLDESVSLLQSDEQYKQEKNLVYYGDCVMRGPLFISREAYERIGGLDISSFFLGCDDLEMSMRFAEHCYLVCYSPVRFYSPLNIGSTRKSKTLSRLLEIVYNIILRSTAPSISKKARKLASESLHIRWHLKRLKTP